MTTPRTSSRAESGSAVSSLGRAAPMPTAPATVQNLIVGTTPAALAVGGFSASLTRFLDTLGIADNPVWRGPQDGECLF